MFKKIAALLLCMALIAGCSAAPSQPAASSQPEASSGETASSEAPAENFTYQNPDPDMVMITTKDGDITYKDYRFYMDITEMFSRFTSRQQLAICHTLEKDLAEKQVAINEEEYNTMAQTQLDMIYQYYTNFADDVKMVAELAGLTMEEAEEVLKLSFRMDYLIAAMGDHYQAIAREEIGEFDPSAVEVEEDAGYDPETVIEQKRLEHEEKIYDHGNYLLDEYSKHYNDRIVLDNEEIIAAIDGEDVAYDDLSRNFIEYNSVSARFDNAALIQQGELVIRELEQRGKLPDEKTFAADFDTYIGSVKADTEYIAKIEPYCEELGATIDDYFAAFKRMAWLEEVGTFYQQLLAEEYTNLYPVETPAEGETAAEPEVTFDDFCIEKMDKLFEGSEIVNIMGK